MTLEGSRRRARRGRRGALPAVLRVVAVLPLLLSAFGCRPRKPRFAPDATLRQELGLTDQDEVHRVMLTATASEEARPESVTVSTGAYVEFVTGDWRLHEVHFELDSLDEAARSFLQESDQVSSPPLVDRDSRFVVRFLEAPAGRYPFLVEGNGAPDRGVVIVRPNP